MSNNNCLQCIGHLIVLLLAAIIALCLVILSLPEHSNLTDPNSNRVFTEYKEFLQRVVTVLPNPSLIAVVEINRPPRSQQKQRLAAIEIQNLAKSLPSSIGVVNKTNDLHKRVVEIMDLHQPAEFSFKSAIRGIDQATITLISEISLFILEIDSNRICTATEALGRTINATDDLLTKLENALPNIATLESKVGQLYNNLIEVRLDVSKERRNIKQEEDKAKNQWFPNKEKLNQMDESSTSLSSIERVAGELLSSFKTAHTRITEAISHLNSSSAEMKEIFSHLSRLHINIVTVYHKQNTPTPSPSCFQCDKLSFNSNQRKTITQVGEVVYTQLKEARKKNEKVIEKISVWGFDAISEK